MTPIYRPPEWYDNETERAQINEIMDARAHEEIKQYGLKIDSGLKGYHQVGEDGEGGIELGTMVLEAGNKKIIDKLKAAGWSQYDRRNTGAGRLVHMRKFFRFNYDQIMSQIKANDKREDTHQ